jgi:hypothetical protein
MKTKLIWWPQFILLSAASLFAQMNPGIQNLKHSWTFEDGTANDYLGGANGYLMNGAKVKDGALVTDSLQYLELPAEDVALQTYQEFTCETWFQPDSGKNNNYHMFFYFGDSKNGLGYNGFFMTPTRGDNVSRAAISTWTDTPYQGEDAANGPEYDDGKLHHMVATLSNAEINLFLDGTQAISPTGAAQGPTPLSSHNTIDALGPFYCYFCKSGYDGDATWRGKILEFNIYNRILTSDEILSLYQKGPITTDVDENPIADLPMEYGLMQNYPNPFNPSTTISFNLQKKAKVTIAIYDMLGHQVAELLNDMKNPGQSSVQFDGSNLSSGLYLCRMQLDGRQIFTKKMMLLK